MLYSLANIGQRALIRQRARRLNDFSEKNSRLYLCEVWNVSDKLFKLTLNVFVPGFDIVCLQATNGDKRGLCPGSSTFNASFDFDVPCIFTENPAHKAHVVGFVVFKIKGFGFNSRIENGYLNHDVLP